MKNELFLRRDAQNQIYFYKIRSPRNCEVVILSCLLYEAVYACAMDQECLETDKTGDFDAKAYKIIGGIELAQDTVANALENQPTYVSLFSRLEDDLQSDREIVPDHYVHRSQPQDAQYIETLCVLLEIERLSKQEVAQLDLFYEQDLEIFRNALKPIWQKIWDFLMVYFNYQHKTV